MFIWLRLLGAAFFYLNWGPDGLGRAHKGYEASVPSQVRQPARQTHGDRFLGSAQYKGEAARDCPASKRKGRKNMYGREALKSPRIFLTDKDRERG